MTGALLAKQQLLVFYMFEFITREKMNRTYRCY